jgi:hypothetical protein
LSGIGYRETYIFRSSDELKLKKVKDRSQTAVLIGQKPDINFDVCSFEGKHISRLEIRSKSGSVQKNRRVCNSGSDKDISAVWYLCVIVDSIEDDRNLR